MHSPRGSDAALPRSLPLPLYMCLTCSSGVTGGGGEGGEGWQGAVYLRKLQHCLIPTSFQLVYCFIAASENSYWEISAYLTGKKRQGKKGKVGENGEEKKENCKKWKEGKLQNEMRRRPIFFFFAFHFSKQLKFVLGLPKWKISTRKKHFKAGKKSGKMTLPPQKNFLLCP